MCKRGASDKAITRGLSQLNLRVHRVAVGTFALGATVGYRPAAYFMNPSS